MSSRSEGLFPPQSLLLTYRPLVADRVNLADREGDGAGLAAASLQPVLDGQTGDLLEVADIPRDDGEVAIQSDRGYAQVGVADRRSPALQLGPHLAVATGGGGVEGKHGKVGEQRLVQPLGGDAGALPSAGRAGV